MNTFASTEEIRDISFIVIYEQADLERGKALQAALRALTGT